MPWRARRTCCWWTSRPTGFDDQTAAATRSLALRHAAGGGAVIWATRRLDVLLGLASGVTLLAAGACATPGTVETLAERALAGTDAADSNAAAPRRLT